MLSDAAKRTLLEAARAAVKGETTTSSLEDVMQARAAFVSLHTKTRELRGCIGNFAFSEPLLTVVQRMARAAAFEDPRFPPVQEGELADLVFEISALTPPKPIEPEQVEIGRHGLLISKGFSRGVLLPQVPVEWGWDLLTFLQQLCRKAGLPSDAWQTAKLEGFEAEVFSETSLAKSRNA